MARNGFESVDAYLAAKPPHVRAALEQVRRTVRKAVPDAVEVISYQMPACKLAGRILLYFAGWTDHLSIYPATGPVMEALGPRLAPHRAGRGTLRFDLARPVPVRLIARFASLRAEELRSGAEARAVRRRRAGEVPIVRHRGSGTPRGVPRSADP